MILIWLEFSFGSKQNIKRTRIGRKTVSNVVPRRKCSPNWVLFYLRMTRIFPPNVTTSKLFSRLPINVAFNHLFVVECVKIIDPNTTKECVSSDWLYVRKKMVYFSSIMTKCTRLSWVEQRERDWKRKKKWILESQCHQNLPKSWLCFTNACQGTRSVKQMICTRSSATRRRKKKQH